MPDTNEHRDAAQHVLWWAMVELGLATLIELVGYDLLAPDRPAIVHPERSTFAGPVALVDVRPRARVTREVSAIAALREVVTPGCGLLIHTPAATTPAFGSNVLLEALLCGARAVFTDGASRDVDLTTKLPVMFAAATSTPIASSALGLGLEPVEALDLFGLHWATGDWILADRDGLARLPGDRVDEVAAFVLASSNEPQRVYGIEAGRFAPRRDNA
jgi:regulator of RNase E activity RraA